MTADKTALIKEWGQHLTRARLLPAGMLLFVPGLGEGRPQDSSALMVTATHPATGRGESEAAREVLAGDPEITRFSFTVTLLRNKCALNNRCCIKHPKTRQISH